MKTLARSIVTLALALPLLSAVVSAQRSREVRLIDGQSLDGWIQRGGKAKYRAENGQIIGTTVPNTGNSFLCTKRDYTNFVLELDFKVDPGLNSGVQIRSQCFDAPRQLQHKDRTIRVPAGRVHGYQIEIDPGKRAWSGGIYDEGRRGWLADLKTNTAAQAAFRPNDWNSFRIEARNDRLRTWINGVPAADLRDSLTPAGFIALQVHGIGKRTNQMEVRWRNIRITELE